MDRSNLTRHGMVRAQQRAIPHQIIEWLQAYGAEEYDHHGGCIRYFDHSARRRLAKEVGKKVVSHLGALLNTYAVLSLDGEVITLGHRQKRIKHH